MGVKLGDDGRLGVDGGLKEDWEGELHVNIKGMEIVYVNHRDVDWNCHYEYLKYKLY